MDLQNPFPALQSSKRYKKTPFVCSYRNYLIDQYDDLVVQHPDDYTGNIYKQVLPPSATRSNYSAAADYTHLDTVCNRTRWSLQSNLLQYGINHGYQNMIESAENSTAFSYHLHQSSFQFSNGTDTIGKFPWAVLTKVDLPYWGAEVGNFIYLPGAFLRGVHAGVEQFARTGNAHSANLVFEQAFDSYMGNRYDLGARLINQTIETTNSPHGHIALPWYGKVLRFGLDIGSELTDGWYD